MVAGREQHQVQQQQQHQQFAPCQRTPVPMRTPIAMSSSSAQAAHSHPNSCAGTDVPQLDSSLPGPGISCSGSAVSIAGLSWAGSSVPGATYSQLAFNSLNLYNHEWILLFNYGQKITLICSLKSLMLLLFLSSTGRLYPLIKVCTASLLVHFKDFNREVGQTNEVGSTETSRLDYWG